MDDKDLKNRENDALTNYLREKKKNNEEHDIFDTKILKEVFNEETEKTKTRSTKESRPAENGRPAVEVVKSIEPLRDLHEGGVKVAVKAEKKNVNVTSTDTIQISSLKSADITSTNEIPQNVDEVSADETAEEYEEYIETAEERKARIKQLKAQKRHRRTFTHIFGAVLLSVLIISVSAVLAVFIVRTSLDFTGVGKTFFETQIEINSDTTTKDIAQKLTDSGIIYMPEIFCMYANMIDAEKDYKNGYYKLDTTMSYSTLIRTLQTTSNITETVQIQITEGMTAQEIGALLEENKVCTAKDFEACYKNLKQTYKFEKRLENQTLKFYQMEGYLFPDTYEFYVIPELDEPDMDTSSYADAAADIIFSNFNEKITSGFYSRMNKLNLTLNEVITLASIVQREADSVENMENVASVFLNRLNDSETFPRLESDVTVLYVENNIKPKISADALSLYQKTFDAYNTYVREGIPVGPICNPGLDAIKAVLYAPDTSYYYFCANPETTEMYFASTIAEHEENLRICGLEDVIAD